MDFHGMKRKDLQTLCKKHGIPANLKNSEMATRLASVFEKEEEETITETKCSAEDDSVEDDGIKEKLVGSRKAKKVTFSPDTDNEVFEFTRSLKKLRGKSVRTRRQDGNVEIRRSKRTVAKGITVAGSDGSESKSISEIVEAEKGCTCTSSDVTEAHKVTRRSKRIGSSDLIAVEQFEDQDVSRLAEDIQDGFQFEKVGRRSTRLAVKTSKPCVEDGTSKGGALLPAKESEKERKTMQSKRPATVNSREDEFAKGKTKEHLIDYEVQTTEKYRRVEVQDVSKVDMVTRRSTRLCNKVNVPLVDENVKAVNRDGLEVETAPKQSKSVSELLVDGQVQKGDRQPKRTSGNDREDMRLLRRSKRTALDKMLGQAMSNSLSRCPVIDSERDGASVDNVKLNVNDEMQVRVRFTRNYSKKDSIMAARVVEGNLVDKKTDETLVKSSKRVTRRMKRDRPAEPGTDRGTATTQSNLTPEKTLDEYAQFEQEEACGADVEARGSSKKSNTKNQDCIKDKPQGIIIIEDAPSSSEAKAAESVMIIEKVLDPKSVDSSQRSNNRELNCELMKGECEEKHERDTVSIPVMEEDKEEVTSRSLLLIECLSPDSVPLAVSSPKAKLHVPTGHTLAKDTVIVEDNTKTKDETLNCASEYELKEHSSIAKLANVEDILENSTECWKEIHSSKDDEKGSLEKDVQAEDLHGNFSECNTENSRAEEEMEISKVGGMSVGHCVNLTPEKLLGEYAQLEPEEAERPNVEARSSFQKMKKTVGQEFVKGKPHGMAEDSPSRSESNATEPVVIPENVLDSTRKVSGDTSAVRNSHESNSELMEGEREEKHEQPTVLLAATKIDKGEASSLSEFRIERSEVKTCPDKCSTGCSLSVETTLTPASVQLAMNNQEADLGVPAGKDVVSTVITEEDKMTEETLIFTPKSELKEHSSVAKLAEIEAILGNSAECCKENEKGCLEKDVQVENLHGNFSECNTESSSAEEEMGISKVGCMSVGLCVNLTPEILLDAYTLLVAEEAGVPNVEARSSSKKMMTVSQEVVKENPQGMAENSSSTPETKATEPVMIPEQILDSSLKVSVDISLVRNAHELSSELMGEECEEKQEQDTLLMAATKTDKQEASSLSEFLTERPEVSIPESELLVETTPPPSSVRLAVSNPESEAERNSESELGVPTGHILFKDIDGSSVFTTPERNLMLMEQLSECGKIRAADIVKHNDEEVESHAVVFTTPEQVLLLGDSGLDQVGKEEEHTAADFPDGSDVLNTRQNEAFDERIVVALHDESNIAAIPLRQSSVGDFKGDGIVRKEENRAVELHCESDTCTSPNRRPFLGSFVPDGAKNSGGSKAMENYEESVLFTGLEERQESFKYYRQDTAREGEVKLAAQIYDEAGLSTGMHKDNADKSGLCMSLERQLLYGDSEQKKAVETAEKAAAEFRDQSAVPNISAGHLFPEESELEEAEKSEEDKAVELQVGCDLFTKAEKLLLLETNEGTKGDNRIVKSHDMSDVLTASESHSLMGDFEPNESENKYSENKDAELLSESNISTNMERHLLSGDCGLDGTRKIKDNTAACEESLVFSSPERRHHLGNSEPHTAGKEVEFKDESAFFTRLESRLLLGESGQDRLGNSKSGSSLYQSHRASSPTVILKDESVVWGSHVSALDIAASSRSIASKVSCSHEFNVGKATEGAELMPKSSQAENVAGLDVTQGTSKQSRGNSPRVDLVNLFDFDIEGADTIMDVERIASSSSYVLALPAEGNSETIGEMTSPFEVAGNCPWLSEESSPSKNIQKQINDPLEELAITDNNEADEVIGAKVTKNVDSSCGSSFSGKTCVLAVTEDEHLVFTIDEATDPIATAFAADEEMVSREATPSPEETLNESSENRKEYVNIGGSGTSSEKQVRREPMLIYRTQVKPKRHDMKENAPNSKIVDNLNVTAPRTTKRRPLQDLRKN